MQRAVAGPLPSVLIAALTSACASLGGSPQEATTPDASVVEGVQSLVAGSVEGLTPGSVMVLDDHPDTTIIWVLESGASTGASTGGGNHEVV